MSLPAAVLGCIWTACALATCLQILRIIAVKKAGHVRVDFVLSCLGWMVGIVANVFSTISVSYGAGLHQDTLSGDDVAMTVKYQWFTFYAYVWSVTLVKSSIFAFLIEFERDLTLIRRYLLFAVAILSIVVNLSTSVLQWVQCVPVEKTWDKRVVGVCNGRQRNQIGGFVQGSVGAAVDIFLCVYPWIVFWSIQIDRKVRVGLSLLFSVGLISAVIEILKTTDIKKLSVADVTYGLASNDIYSLVQLWVALICGCLPTTKSVWGILLNKKPSTESRKNAGYGIQVDSDVYKMRSDLYSVSKPSKYKVGTSTERDDFSSDENILLRDREHIGGSQGILMTRTVHVGADKASDNV